MIVQLTKPPKGPIRLTLPWKPGVNNRAFLKTILGPRTRLAWNSRRREWIIARSNFDKLCAAIPELKGGMRVIIYSTYSDSQMCDQRCVEAMGLECVCFCGGENHGGVNATYNKGWRMYNDKEVYIEGSKHHQRSYWIPSGEEDELDS